jgi:intraflagellar transport protein 122
VPLSSPMYQYLERKEFGSAYTTGCLGVTESDWRSLGREALDTLDLDVATKAYTRLKASLCFVGLRTKLLETLKL